MATLQAPTWDASPDARSRSRSNIGASQVPEWSLIRVDREEIPFKASPWTALQYMIREKNCRLCARFHALRDELVENSEGGRAARDLESFGSIQQELPAPALDLVGCFPDDSASLVKLNLDKSVYPHIMLLNAEVSRACFLSLLETVCPRDDPRYKLQVGPIMFKTSVASPRAARSRSCSRRCSSGCGLRKGRTSRPCAPRCTGGRVL